MSKRPFWSRDRLVKYELNCLELELGFWLGLIGVTVSFGYKTVKTQVTRQRAGE